MGRVGIGLKTTAAAIVLGTLIGALLVAKGVSVPAARANDAPLATAGGRWGAMGGTVTPVWTTDVRLAAETVQVVCFGEFAEYRVDFRFVNEGKRRRVKLGFPFADTDSVEGGPSTTRPIGFQAWQNGRPLTVRAVPSRYGTGLPEKGYFVHRAVFPPGPTTITVSYLAEVAGSDWRRRRRLDADDAHAGDERLYDYWLHTGSPWKGPIGKAVVRYRFADTFRGRDIGLTATDARRGVSVTAPPGWSRPLPRTVQWLFTDFEPEPRRTDDAWFKSQSPYDIVLAYSDKGGPKQIWRTWTGSSAIESRFGEGAHDTDCLQDGNLGSCWTEGVQGPGVGEWVEKSFGRLVRLRELRVLPGNNAYDSSFGRYGRPRTLRAVFSDGSAAVLRLRDAPALQRFPVDATTRSVRLVVESVYPGADYPATCISEVEFGMQRAPGYAPFRRLIVDPRATGRLPAWAGPSAPEPRHPGRTIDYLAAYDIEAYTGGDLIGISESAPFPADVAPFKEPATLAALRARDRDVRLPAVRLVGTVTGVNALSTWTYEIRYSSGVDLLVNTRLSNGPSETVLSDLVKGTDGFWWSDDRDLTYEVVTVGGRAVGVARAGRGEGMASSVDVAYVPAQVFWRDGDRSYHLYARSKTVTVAHLMAVARSMIEPQAVADAGSVDSESPAWPWWQAWVLVAAAAGALALVVGFVRHRAQSV